MTRSAFARARRAEVGFVSKMISLVKHIGDILRHFKDDGPNAGIYIRNALSRYAGTIDPWAKAVANRMTTEVASRDRTAWIQASRNINRGLVREIDSAPIGDTFKRLMDQQVGLIKSLPLDAGLRAHDIVIDAMNSGARPDTIADKIMQLEHITRSRAVLIAKTEMGRAATTLQQVRAQYVGSPGYIWRTMHDEAVRLDHRELDGKFFAWDEPPVADRRTGARAHPGCIYNCRCFAEPVLPGVDGRAYRPANGPLRYLLKEPAQ